MICIHAQNKLYLQVSVFIWLDQMLANNATVALVVAVHWLQLVLHVRRLARHERLVLAMLVNKGGRERPLLLLLLRTHFGRDLVVALHSRGLPNVGKVKAARSVGEGLLSQRWASHGSDQRWRDYEWWGTILFQAITSSFLKTQFCRVGLCQVQNKPSGQAASSCMWNPNQLN